MPGRTIAIGDIHGCAKALDALLARLHLKPEDTLVTLGDYVDRGHDSRGVLTSLLEVSRRCRLVPLLGNHELMLREVLAGRMSEDEWSACGGRATVASYGGKLDAIPEDHLQFLQNLHRYHQTDRHLFVHANYSADLDLDSQPDFLLLWEHISFTLPPRHHSGKTAIVGHTPQRSGEVYDVGHLICIDTFCVGGGWLTALDVESGQLWQVDKYGHARDAVEQDPENHEPRGGEANPETPAPSAEAGEDSP